MDLHRCGPGDFIMRRLIKCIAVVGLLLLVFGLLLVVWHICVAAKEEIKHNTFASEDIFAGLVYFLELNQGRFPNTASEFLQSSFVQDVGDGRIRIVGRNVSPYWKRVYGEPFMLSEFNIRWGTPIATLLIDAEGCVRHAEGRPVLLVDIPKNPEGSLGTTKELIRISKELRHSAPKDAG